MWGRKKEEDYSVLYNKMIGNDKDLITNLHLRMIRINSSLLNTVTT